MPFMHSEHLPDQSRCVDLFRNAGNTENLKYAEDHADIVARFGASRIAIASWARDDAGGAGIS